MGISELQNAPACATSASRRGGRIPFRLLPLAFLMLIPAMAGCDRSTPSQKLRERVALPIPAAKVSLPRQERLSKQDFGERYELTPHSLIPISFNLQPDIKASYQRFKSEEGRYDFFYTSRDSLTPKVSVDNTWNEDERPGEEWHTRVLERDREHTTALSVEKRFFDTTEMEVGIGHSVTAEDAGHGQQPFALARLRYPLWASRERLERTSEEIFRRNELNDAQLNFIQTVRAQLNNALARYYRAVYNIRLRDHAREWQSDLESLLPILAQAPGDGVQDDRRRLEAEIASVKARDLDFTSQTEVQIARLKADCGLPFHAQIEIVDEDFDPFAGLSHEELLMLGIETDPEIATLKNAMNNAQVQLELARRGRWDVALVASGKTAPEGSGATNDRSDWSLSVGMAVSAVDDRVTSSLIRQAQADIERFSEAIVSRENAIFVDTLEPLIRNRSLQASNEELREGLGKFEQDFKQGIDEFVSGELNLDNLLTRREKIYSRQTEIALQSFYIGINTSSLCAATGKFFELLNGHNAAEHRTTKSGPRPEDLG